jgi:succinate dehydrogenase flavin-adding protein (antitoxin of CptAB toxin-antitoxin module)
LCLVRWPADEQEPTYDEDDDRFDGLRRVGDKEIFSWLMDHVESRQAFGFKPVDRLRRSWEAQA